MTTTPHIVLPPEVEPAVQARSLKVGSRLMLGANVSVQLSFLFAFLYLRANNFDGMWHPSGVSSPPIGLTVAALVVMVVSVVALWMAVGGMEATGARSAVTPALAVALLAGLVGIGLRVFLLTHFNATLDQGGYVDISILWYAVIAAEVVIGCLWLLKVLAGHARGTAIATQGEVRAVAEYWLLLTGAAFGVFLLVQFVT